MQIFSSASCLEAEGSGDISDICLLSRLESEPRKQNQRFHTSETLLQRIKRCCFFILWERMRAIVTKQNPAENTERGDKIGFPLLLLLFIISRVCREATTFFRNTWRAEWHCWKHQLTCTDCLPRHFYQFCHKDCLSEIMRHTVDRSHACQCQHSFQPLFGTADH